jgi:N-acetyl-gamma-glutamylphosphate reductase
MFNSKFIIQTKERINCKAIMEENATIIIDLPADYTSNHSHKKYTNYYKHKNMKTSVSR